MSALDVNFAFKCFRNWSFQPRILHFSTKIFRQEEFRCRTTFRWQSKKFLAAVPCRLSLPHWLWFAWFSSEQLRRLRESLQLLDDDAETTVQDTGGRCREPAVWTPTLPGPTPHDCQDDPSLSALMVPQLNRSVSGRWVQVTYSDSLNVEKIVFTFEIVLLPNNESWSDEICSYNGNFCRD